MAENNRPFGQGFEDFLKEKGRAVIENPTVRSVAGGAKDLLFDYVIDPSAEQLTRVSSYRPAGLPSILDIMTPKTPPGSYEDVKSITENPTDKRKKLEPYVYNPNVTPLERLGMHAEQALAEIKYRADQQFGGAHRAGIKMLQDGVAFDDLPPELKEGTYRYLSGVAALVPFTKPVKAAQAVGQTSKQIAKDVGNVVTKKDSGFRLSAGGPPTDVLKKLNTAKPEISDEELAALSRFYYGLPTYSKAQNQLRAAIKEADPEIFFRMSENRRRELVRQKAYEEKVRKFGVDDQGNPLNPGTGRKKGMPGTTKQSLINDDKRKAIESVLLPVWKKAEKRDGKAVLPANWKNEYIPIINKKYPKLFANDPLTTDKMSRLLGNYDDPSRKKRNVVLMDKVINESTSSRASRLDKQVAKLTGQSDMGGLVPTIARSVGEDLQDAKRFDEFFTSQGINLKKLRSSGFDQKTFTRDYLQTVFRGDETLQKYLRNQPYNYNEKRGYIDITLNRSHVDRSIAAGDDVSKQFQGMDAGDIKILGATVNNVLQKDLERALVNYIKNKDVKNSKRIIGEMNDFFIGTKLNDPSPNFPKLNADDYKWLDKNKVVKIPTISAGAGRPFKNTDAVLFGTREQPSASEILKGELVARQLNAAKRAYKREEGNVTDFYKLLNQGGYVGDMIPVKASTGFFARMFGKPPLFRKEGMDVQDITTPTKKQQATLESLYPGVAFPETYPGEVFFSNLELSLAKRDAPKLFATDKEFYDYINRQGVGVDELDDAKVSNYVIQRAKEGQPILSDDVISIAQQSPLRNIYIDAYGFRSDKINIAPKNKFDRTGALVQTAGQGVSKSPSYSNTGLKDGYIDGSYRERVLRLPKDSLRGDPGTIPGGRSPHTFGRDVGDENGVYTIGWTRQTDRPAFILPGQTVNKETGEIIIPPQVADRTQLTNIEDKITKLFEDPITNLRLVDGQFDPDQAALVTQQVNSLVEKTGGKINADKAYTILLTQAKQKQNQIKKLQNDYNTEKDRLDNFVPASRLDVTATVIDEAQSDIMQNANRKARELALRLDVMAENNIPLDQVRDKELLEYFKQTGGIARPVGKTKEELKSQFEELKRFNEILKNLSETPPYAITPTAINAYRDQIKNRQTAIIDEMAENISKDLMEQLYPDVPLKDRVQYLDALFKQSVAEAAYRKFIEKDPNAPNFIGVMGGKQVTSSYSQEGSTSTAPEIIADDKKLRIKNFKRRIEAGEETATIEPSRFPGVGTYEFYGGPEATDAAGKHYTGAAESIMNKIAQEYGSKLQILNVSTGQMRRSEVYNIVDQDTGGVVGTGETYRQAESIANDLVDNQGGRYRIQRGQSQSFESEPIYGFELTPQMLQLFKIYK